MKTFDLHKKADFLWLEGENRYVKCGSIIEVFNDTIHDGSGGKNINGVYIITNRATPSIHSNANVYKIGYNSHIDMKKGMEKLFNSLQQCGKR